VREQCSVFEQYKGRRVQAGGRGGGGEGRNADGEGMRSNIGLHHSSWSPATQRRTSRPTIWHCSMLASVIRANVWQRRIIGCRWLPRTASRRSRPRSTLSRENMQHRCGPDASITHFSPVARSNVGRRVRLLLASVRPLVPSGCIFRTIQL